MRTVKCRMCLGKLVSEWVKNVFFNYTHRLIKSPLAAASLFNAFIALMFSNLHSLHKIINSQFIALRSLSIDIQNEKFLSIFIARKFSHLWPFRELTHMCMLSNYKLSNLRKRFYQLAWHVIKQCRNFQIFMAPC